MADIEISKFVSGIVGGKSTSRNPRRCYRTSTSSGYSSHSPPLSAGSYSYYASASTKDPSYSGLAVIHESEAIPRPIWPSVIYHQAENHSGDYEGNEKRRLRSTFRKFRSPKTFLCSIMTGIYTCRVCGCTYNYSPPSLPPPPPPPPPPTSPSRAREVLLELSRTLNSVIDGDVTAAPEEILRDISRIVSLEIGARNDNVYEYVCPSWALNDKNPSVRPNCARNVPSRVNPINSKLYVSPRYVYGYNPAWSAPLLESNRTAGHKDDGEETRKSSGQARKKSCENESKYSTVSTFLLAQLARLFEKERLFGFILSDYIIVLQSALRTSVQLRYTKRCSSSWSAVTLDRPKKRSPRRTRTAGIDV